MTLSLPTRDPYEELGLLFRAVGEPVPQWILVEFESEKVLEVVRTTLAKQQPGRIAVILRYDYAEQDASRLFADAQRQIAEAKAASGSGHLPPLLILAESIRVMSGREEKHAIEFWRQMNFLRENWGRLEVQLLLWVTPWSHRLLRNYAADLRDWTNLRVVLHYTPFESQPNQWLLPPSPLAYPNLSIPPELVPGLVDDITNEIAASSPDWSKTLRRRALSAFAGALSLGSLEKARTIHQWIGALQFNSSDNIQWLEWNYILEAASLDPSGMQRCADALIHLADNGRTERIRHRALQAIVRLTDLWNNLKPLAAAAPLIENARAAFDLARPRQAAEWSRLGIAAEIIRLSDGKPTPEEDLDISLPQRANSRGSFGWPEIDTLERLALLQTRQAVYAMEIGKPGIFFPVFELLGEPSRLTVRAGHTLLLFLISIGRAASALQQYDWLRAAAESVLGRSHPEFGLILHHFSGIHEVTGKKAEALSLALQAAEIVAAALGPEHPVAKTVIARTARLQQLEGFG